MWGIIATWCMARDGVMDAGGRLAQRGSAADTVETVVRAVEDCPFFKSVGYGGLPNEEMEVELDAAFMDGDTLEFGAVGALKNFANPVSVARSLAGGEANNLLVGQGAEKYADKMGFERKNMLTELVGQGAEKYADKMGFERKNMLTERAKGFYAKRLAQEGARVPGAARSLGEPEAEEESARGAMPRAGIDSEGTNLCGHDTVGAVCLDARGSMTAATRRAGEHDRRDLHERPVHEAAGARGRFPGPRLRLLRGLQDRRLRLDRCGRGRHDGLRGL